jgi:hypothetical protein
LDRSPASLAKRLARLPLHPFLFSALFVVYLLAENLDDQVKFGDLFSILAAVLAATALVLGLLWALIVPDPGTITSDEDTPAP